MEINPKERMDTQVHTYPGYHSKELVLRTGDAQRYNRMGLHNSTIPGNIYLSE
jgi:hypothetical protein